MRFEIFYLTNAESENTKLDGFIVGTGLVILDKAKPCFEVRTDNDVVFFAVHEDEPNLKEKNKLT